MGPWVGDLSFLFLVLGMVNPSSSLEKTVFSSSDSLPVSNSDSLSLAFCLLPILFFTGVWGAE